MDFFGFVPGRLAIFLAIFFIFVVCKIFTRLKFADSRGSNAPLRTKIRKKNEKTQVARHSIGKK